MTATLPATLVGGRVELEAPAGWARTESAHVVAWLMPHAPRFRTTLVVLLEDADAAPAVQPGQVLLEESDGRRVLGLATPAGEVIMAQRRIQLPAPEGGTLVVTGTALADRWDVDGPALEAALASVREVRGVGHAADER